VSVWRSSAVLVRHCLRFEVKLGLRKLWGPLLESLNLNGRIANRRI
jgi:hypothetical protein